ncbi:MAG: hypothetical protein IPK16_32885 [Anaerolineales bacterium]|nr:hypothetical protein [Anaerolineales bacterium]
MMLEADVLAGAPAPDSGSMDTAKRIVENRANGLGVAGGRRPKAGAKPASSPELPGVKGRRPRLIPFVRPDN